LWKLAQSAGIRGSAGEPIPVPWKAFEEAGIIPRRGQLILVAAGPGIGKSAMVLNLILEAMVPSLLYSADSDAFTQLSRSIAITEEILVQTAADMILEENIPEEIKDNLRDIPLLIDYDSSPTPFDIEEILAAYYELCNEFPALIVVDNITNVVTDASDSGDPFSGLEALMDYLHDMARVTGACVIGLHHVKGEHSSGTKPIPIDGVKGQIHRVPEMVLTMFKKPLDNGRWALCVSAVKNRGGKADPTGESYVELEFDGPTMKVSDVSYTEPSQVEIDWEPDEDRRMYEEVNWG
jgi:predicted ATP-dependent serine protease